MDFTFDSLSQRVSEIRSELSKTVTSLDKLNSYGNFVPSGCKKHILIPGERDAPSEESYSEQDKLSNSAESEESGSEDDQPSKKVALQSAVVKKVESSKTRKKFICTHNSDNKVQLRNRRFLGLVQNTLQKFQAEEVRRQPQDLKRKKVIEKVEAAAEDEKKSVKRQRAELLSKSRKQRMELECLEKMMKIAESFELWENNQKHLLNYIKTKTAPQIFFLPRSHTPTTKKRLEKSRLETIGKIEKQRACVEEILSRIKQSYEISDPTVSTEGASVIPKVSTEESALISKVSTEETTVISKASTEETSLISKASTEETSLTPEISSTQYVLKQEITDKKPKESEEILQLDLSENECDDIC